MNTDRNLIKYCKIRFRLLSPLEIGSGENNFTDHDLIRDSEGKPFIPASAIAGYFREALFCILLPVKGKEEARDIINSTLGYVRINAEEDNGILEPNDADTAVDPDFPQSLESTVFFYDATINEEHYHISRRDQVALNDYKSSLTGAKFDAEILEPDVTFDTYLEETLNGNNCNSMIDKILRIWSTERVSFGAKTTRGMGITQIEKILIKDFDLNTPEGTEAWVDFSIYGGTYGDSFTEEDDVTGQYIDGNTEQTSGNDCTITLSLQQEGGISIRKYTTGSSVSMDPSFHKKSLSKPASSPDYEQMTEHVSIKQDARHGADQNGDRWISESRPVIPGTSWAGAFRHHMKVLMSASEHDLGKWFGYVKGKNKEKSLISFSDSIIEGSRAKIISRNAIDRFSGGTIDGALFTEKTYYGGRTELSIRFREDIRESVNKQSAVVERKYKEAFAASIADLHAGLMAIGGLTAVGRGIFKVTGFNGIPFTGDAEDLYKMVLEFLCAKTL